MFDIESKNQDEITINTKRTSITFNVADSIIKANLGVGEIHGPGEFEIGDATVRGISIAKSIKQETKEGESPVVIDTAQTIYDVEIGGIHIGIIGGCEKGLDDLGMSDILCTSSVRAVREIEPKVVISMGNIDGMVTELKVSARVEKKYKVKNLDSLPATLDVVALN